ncbi:MAG TPA: DUF4276 family protein [Bryobacteraceae bacterium]|nr:DUF4276 family protein [Bryobacteraceae bacterium]
MVRELRIYYEGDHKLKPGLHEFLREIREIAQSQRCQFRLIDTDGTPVQDFRDALKANREAWNVLLLDSDAPHNRSHADLCRSKDIDPAHEGSVFWMVEVMEAWFLADIESLIQYYGAGFREDALRGNPEVEKVSKTDVLSRLKRATQATKPGEYHKTKHAPDLLAAINVGLVRRAAPNCDRLFSLVLAKLSET